MDVLRILAGGSLTETHVPKLINLHPHANTVVQIYRFTYRKTKNLV